MDSEKRFQLLPKMKKKSKGEKNSFFPSIRPIMVSLLFCFDFSKTSVDSLVPMFLRIRQFGLWFAVCDQQSFVDQEIKMRAAKMSLTDLSFRRTKIERDGRRGRRRTKHQHSLVSGTLLALPVEARETLEPPTSTQKAKAWTNKALVEKRWGEEEGFTRTHTGENRREEDQPCASWSKICSGRLDEMELFVSMMDVSIHVSSADGVSRPLHWPVRIAGDDDRGETDGKTWAYWDSVTTKEFFRIGICPPMAGLGE